MDGKVRMTVRGLGEDHSILFEVSSFGLYKAEDFAKLYRDACWVSGVVRVVLDVTVPVNLVEERRASPRREE